MLLLGELGPAAIRWLAPGDVAFVEGAISTTTGTRIERVRQGSQLESDALGQFFRDTKGFDFPVGIACDLAQVFAPLRDVEEATITIRDPYLFSREHSLRSAVELLDGLNSLCGGVLNVTLIWRREDSPNDALKRFKTKLKRQHLGSIHITPAPRRRGEGGHFHDRHVSADVTRRGERMQFRWKLTSGVDNLMDQSREASVYLSEIE